MSERFTPGAVVGGGCGTMKFAYADPPYLGQGRKLYGQHHAEASIWDDPEEHRKLIAHLAAQFPDGWALSASAPSLKTILPMCPDGTRIAPWVKSFCAFKKGVRPCYAWEPVLFWGGRNTNHPPPEKGGKQTTPKDYYEDWTEVTGVVSPIALKKGLTGAKPEAVCRWILDLLNVQAGDTVVDLFPGTGVMGRVAAEITGVLHVA